MPKLFLGVLALAWLVVLVPPVLRARSASKSRGDSIGDFQNRLGVLGRSNSARRAARRARTVGVGPSGALSASARRAPTGAIGAPALRSPRPSAARPLTGPVQPLRTRASERASRRRREVVTILFAATILTAAVAASLGGTMWWGLQIVTDLLFVTYFAGMLWFRSLAADRMRTLRYLPPVRPRAVPAYALRRTASS